MSYQDVILNRQNGWVEITINRPDKLNSLREQTADEILAILNELEHDKGRTRGHFAWQRQGILHGDRYQRVRD
ncbi:hypothetical protein [Bradyrhizobium sp. CW11]|uniref:hypothetical protein n=1 Tax=Bradyrhizobium sp. CW11 TaxID=2782684 RepID=UPI001FFADC80|nr:hypothetical protein [Bradyrhizobium sp. CW11]